MTAEKPKHDQLFRKSLENPIVAYELLQAHLPQEVLAIIDTSTLKLEKESFMGFFAGRYGFSRHRCLTL